MRKSKENIEKYSKEMMGLKERLVAVAILFALSTTMLMTVSFAWLSLSRNPEVSGVSTTVAANGNLEVALASGTLSQNKKPEESKIGDSNKALPERNITWGNLINLSDPAYGLDNIILKPARLNESNLLNSPFYTAEYSSDGRMEKLSSNFGYAIWVPRNDNSGYFDMSNKLGVRAITTTKIGESNEYSYNLKLMEESAKNANLQAVNAYINITTDEQCMNSLAIIMGTYMTAKLNASQGDETLTNPTMEKKDIYNMCSLFEQFVTVLEKEAAAKASLANFQLYINKNKDANKVVNISQEEMYTAETIISKSNELSSKGIQITNLKQFISDYNQVKADYVKIKAISELETIKWADDSTGEKLSGIIERFIDVGTCTLQAPGGAPTLVNNIGASNATGYLDKECNAVITNGILQKFEQRTGAKMYVGPEYNDGKGLLVKAKVKRMGMTLPGQIYAKVTTNASSPSNFSSDMEFALSKNQGGVAEEVADDTYGFAIDFWVRTNASNSYLTLQGNVLTKSETVKVTGQSMTGQEVDIYTITVKADNDSQTYSYDIYQLTQTNGTTKWYYADSHDEVSEEDLSGQTPAQKMKTVEVVIGFKGDNRVWEGSAGLSVNSTTQGSGSCYVYYADSPEEQAQSLNIIAAMNVAFVDSEGNLLATAYLDTNNYYADNGKVIVPLVLRQDSINVGDSAGNTKLAITSLEKNIAKLITAIVYLDGNRIGNENILASEDIKGQLNIQFGTTVTLNSADNEDLQSKEISVSASVSKASFEFDKETEPMTTTVSLNISGTTPKTVTAFFLRSINAYQGSREQVITFTDDDGDGIWTSDYTFTAPGNYILRSVQLDGIDYTLTESPRVVISGHTIIDVSWNQSSNKTVIMTAAQSYLIPVSVRFATEDINKMPKSVVGRFMKKDGTIASIDFHYNSIGRWTGTADFSVSGEYVLQYLILDGKHVELSESMRKYVTIYLGMKAEIYTDSPIDFKYIPDKMTENEKNLKMKVIIMDNTGKEMVGLDSINDVSLYYGIKTSSVVKMYTKLEWNADSEYYEGAFPVFGAGVYSFLSLYVGENEITNATISPVFTIRSPEPPQFYAHKTPETQYAPDNKAYFNAQLSYTATAKTSAVIYNVNSDEYFTVAVEDPETALGYGETESNIFNWRYIIPLTNNYGKNNQNGNWKLVSINVWDVYDENSNFREKDNPIVIDLQKEEITATVISTLNIKFDENSNQTFNGTFLQKHKVNDITAIISDFNGNQITSVSNVAITYKYDKSTVQENGGYTIGSGVTVIDTPTFIFNKNETNNSLFSANSGSTVQYAGVYTPTKISITLAIYDKNSDKDINYVYVIEDAVSDAPTITVKSTAPSVVISAISPTGTFTADSTGNGSGHKSGVTPEKTTTSATVYFKCSTNSFLFWTFHNYTRPSVTIKLSGIGNASSATLSFAAEGSDTVYMYNNNTQTTEYTWSAGGSETCTRNIGKFTSKSSSTDEKIPAGTLNATRLILLDDTGNEFYVDVNITINNPY